MYIYIYIYIYRIYLLYGKIDIVTSVFIWEDTGVKKVPTHKNKPYNLVRNNNDNLFPIEGGHVTI